MAPFALVTSGHRARRGRRSKPPTLITATDLAGPFVESYVAQQLRPQVDLLGGTLMHVRTSAGEREVDGVVQTRGGIVAFAVKLATRPTRQDVRRLDWLRDQMGDRFRAGYGVHAGADTYPSGNRSGPSRSAN